MHVKTVVGLERFKVRKSRRSYDVLFSRGGVSQKLLQIWQRVAQGMGVTELDVCNYVSKLLCFQSDLKLTNLELFPGFPGCEKKRKVNTKSCFKSAENLAASSPQIGDHRYTSISCASKLLQVQSDLKLKNLVFEVASNELKIGQLVAYRQAVKHIQGFCMRQNSYGFRAI